MTEDRKGYGIAVIVIILLSWLIYSPVIALFGCCLAVCWLFDLLYDNFRKPFLKGIMNGAFIAAMISFLLMALTLFQKSYYVTGWESERHIYEDCKSVTGKSTHCVSTFSAFLISSTEDCALCVERNNKEEKQIEAENRMHDIEEIESKITELEAVKAQLESGEDVDVRDYTFLKDLDSDDIVEMYKDMVDGY